MPYTRNNRRPMRPNVRHAETRRWALVRKADAKTESGVRA